MNMPLSVRILVALQAGPKTKPQLARELKARYDAVSLTVRRLEHRGLAEKVPSPHNPDRRVPLWYAAIQPQEAS